MCVGTRVHIQGRNEIGIVKFIGKTQFSAGEWLGTTTAHASAPTGELIAA